MGMKQHALQLLRRTHLLEMADAVRFRWLSLHQGDARAAFSAGHPGAPLPPDDLAYGAYGTLNWDFYWGFGRQASRVLAQRISGHAASGRVLEWGCGPARIVRHLPDALGSAWSVSGADVNFRSIEWCAGNIPGVRFVAHGAAPPLPFESGEFDCVYAISVFTHLPADMHGRWVAELRRVLKPGGLLICTLNGDAARGLLLDAERPDYDGGRIVVRGGVTTGTRCFVAWHPPDYVRGDLLRDFEVVEHQAAPNLFGERQDLWVARAPPVR